MHLYYFVEILVLGKRKGKTDENRFSHLYAKKMAVQQLVFGQQKIGFFFWYILFKILIFIYNFMAVVSQDAWAVVTAFFSLTDWGTV